MNSQHKIAYGTCHFLNLVCMGLCMTLIIPRCMLLLLKSAFKPKKLPNFYLCSMPMGYATAHDVMFRFHMFLKAYRCHFFS